MKRTVNVSLEVVLKIEVEDEADIGRIVDELDYSFTDTTGVARVRSST